MFSKIFNKNKEPKTPDTPSILGLRVGCSFEIDSLALKLLQGDLLISQCSPTQIIQAVGKVELDGTTLFRFYTDDEAFLQVVAQGGVEDSNVVDVKLYHFFDTLDVGSDADWDNLLYQQIGQPTYTLEGHTYDRVWTSVNDYHQPVHMIEKTYDEDGTFSQTDQFSMLFERPISGGSTESLFLSAEETEEASGQLGRCLVISTGITLTPTQITIHG